MIWLLILALALAGVWRARRRPQPTAWRVTTGGFAIGLLIAAAFVGLRENWLAAIALGVLGLVLALSARWPRRTPPR